MTDELTDNSQIADDETAVEDIIDTKPAKHGGLWFAIILTGLLAICSLAASAYLYQRQKQSLAVIEGQLQAQLQDHFQAQISSLEQSINSLRQAIDSSNQQFDEQIQRMGENSEALRHSLSQVYEQIETPREKWSFEEIHQLLQLALDQLVLANNIDAALSALKIADQRIVSSGDPHLQPVREQIARDIISLQQVERIDLAGTSHRLQALVESIDTLPLASRTSMPQAADNETATGDESKESVWQQIGSDLSGLVRIRRIDQPQVPLLPIEQQYFLRENLKSLLLTARLGLLRSDSKIYRDNLLTAQQWLENYFDTRRQSTQTTIDEINALGRLEPDPDLPSIQGSLESLMSATKER